MIPHAGAAGYKVGISFSITTFTLSSAGKAVGSGYLATSPSLVTFGVQEASVCRTVPTAMPCTLYRTVRPRFLGVSVFEQR